MDIYTFSILISIVIYGLQDDRPFLLEQAAALKIPLRNSGGRGPRRSCGGRLALAERSSAENR
jgi:hypothetical protein